MIYDKMPIVLLSKMASLPEDYTNNRIAQHIISHLDKVDDLTIGTMAENCHVSLSSISRFCRDIGLTDFHELKMMLKDVQFKFESASPSEAPISRTSDLVREIGECLKYGIEALDYEGILELVDDIKMYKRVSAFGLLKAESAAINLQVDLLMQKKIIYTKLAYDEQKKYLSKSDENDLIIVFSYTGTYFTEGFRNCINEGSHPKIYLISGNETSPEDPLINKQIVFSSRQNQLSHPYQLLLISSIISQEYFHRINEK